MNKYVGINAIRVLIANIKTKFAERHHIHEISDVNGLQRKIDELTPPPDIETSEDVIIRINQLTLTMNDMIDNMDVLNDEINTLNGTIDELNETIDLLTPAIGEIYISTSNEHPSGRFGGIWEQIKDTFLLASGDIYSPGSTGGEATHTLTIDEIPSHTHTYKRHAFDRYDTDPDLGDDVYGANNKTLDAREGVTGSSGGGQPHNNMPPYLAVYVWKRIA